jgi:hypothetical protein
VDYLYFNIGKTESGTGKKPFTKEDFDSFIRSQDVYIQSNIKNMYFLLALINGTWRLISLVMCNPDSTIYELHDYSNFVKMTDFLTKNTRWFIDLNNLTK